MNTDWLSVMSTNISSKVVIKCAVTEWTLYKMEDCEKKAPHWEETADAEFINPTFNQIILTSG